MQAYLNKVNGKNRISYDASIYEKIADKICKYYNEEKGQIKVTPPEGYKTVPNEIIEKRSLIDEKEYAQAIGEEEYSDNEVDEDWYESAKKCVNGE